MADGARLWFAVKFGSAHVTPDDCEPEEGLHDDTRASAREDVS